MQVSLVFFITDSKRGLLEASKEVRIMSFNCDRKLSSAIATIRESRAHVICLNEVYPGAVEGVAEELGAPFFAFAPTVGTLCNGVIRYIRTYTSILISNLLIYELIIRNFLSQSSMNDDFIGFYKSSRVVVVTH